MESLIKKSIVLPEGLCDEAEKAAAAEMRSFSGYVSKLLADRLGWKPPVEEKVEEVAS